MIKVCFVNEGIEIAVESGTTVMDAARRAGVYIDAVCGGAGTCGKCLVLINNVKELACRYRVYTDIYVETLGGSEDLLGLFNGTGPVEVKPHFERTALDVEKASFEDRRTDNERISAGGVEVDVTNIDMVSSLYRKLADMKYSVDALIYEGKLVDIISRDGKIFGIALDIGTTTVAAYLYDLESGVLAGSGSALNMQSQYGADVLTRAQYAIKGGSSDLQKVLVDSVNRLVGRIIGESGVDRLDIYIATLVCNTCMHHLFLGLSPESLVNAPYVPAIRQELVLPNSCVGLDINPLGKVFVMPNIDGFVGSDTLAAVLASGMGGSHEKTLLIDVGTNGEIVLSDGKRMLACSTAAGPALEGAGIECGMRGTEGAIDHISIGADGAPNYSVIGGVEPEGICGSGIIDALAHLLESGLMDRTGRLPKTYKIAEGVHISQKDIRELQLAKGAIAAGIKILCGKLGVEADEMDRVFLAGAFGNYMLASSACKISMIPPALEGVVSQIGNAAGRGAGLALVNKEMYNDAVKLAKSIEYVELSVEGGFQEVFIGELEF